MQDKAIGTTTRTTILDNTDLRIIRLLSKDSMISYRNIALTIGISLNAANKMMDNHMILDFIVRVERSSFVQTYLQLIQF